MALRVGGDGAHRRPRELDARVAQRLAGVAVPDRAGDDAGLLAARRGGHGREGVDLPLAVDVVVVGVAAALVVRLVARGVVEEQPGRLDVAHQAGRGRPQQRDGAGDVRPGHRRTAVDAVAAARQARAHVGAGRGDVGLGLLRGAGAAARGGADVAVGGVVAHGVRLVVLAGVAAGAHPGPLLPLEKAGKMPAPPRRRRTSWYQSSPAGPPHELLTMWGRFAGSGFSPARSVGASIHWADAARREVGAAVRLAALGRDPASLPAPHRPGCRRRRRRRSCPSCGCRGRRCRRARATGCRTPARGRTSCSCGRTARPPGCRGTTRRGPDGRTARPSRCWRRRRPRRGPRRSARPGRRGCRRLPTPRRRPRPAAGPSPARRAGRCPRGAPTRHRRRPRRSSPGCGCRSRRRCCCRSTAA